VSISDALPLFLARPPGLVEGVGVQGLLRLARLDHLLDADAGLPGDLCRGRGLAGHGRGGIAELLDAHGELLELAWDAHRPAVVAVVALERARDRGDRVRAERHVARGIEALDGADERKAGDLLEVLERLRPAPVPARQAPRERQEAFEHGVAVAAAAGTPIFEDQLLLGLALREHGDHFLRRGKRIRSRPGNGRRVFSRRDPVRRPSGRHSRSFSVARRFAVGASGQIRHEARAGAVGSAARDVTQGASVPVRGTTAAPCHGAGFVGLELDTGGPRPPANLKARR